MAVFCIVPITLILAAGLFMSPLPAHADDGLRALIEKHKQELEKVEKEISRLRENRKKVLASRKRNEKNIEIIKRRLERLDKDPTADQAHVKRVRKLLRETEQLHTSATYLLRRTAVYLFVLKNQKSALEGLIQTLQQLQQLFQPYQVA